MQKISLGRRKPADDTSQPNRPSTSTAPPKVTAPPKEAAPETDRITLIAFYIMMGALVAALVYLLAALLIL